MAASLWRGVVDSLSSYSYSPSSSSSLSSPADEVVEFWKDPERSGWLTKQGEYIKTWRRRWFVLKQGKLFWFKEPHVTRLSRPRGVIPASTCLTVKGAEDALNRPFAFELSTSRGDTMYFIADSEKEKEEWINSIGRSIVQHSRSLVAKDSEVLDYESTRRNNGAPLAEPQRERSA